MHSPCNRGPITAIKGKKNPRLLVTNGDFFLFKEPFCVMLRTEYSSPLQNNKNNGLPDVT